MPEDIAKTVAMMSRGDIGYSTGQVVMVDGGFNISRSGGQLLPTINRSFPWANCSRIGYLTVSWVILATLSTLVSPATVTASIPMVFINVSDC